MTERTVKGGMSQPLSVRLRAEAEEWESSEEIVALLIEAADAIEMLATVVARLRWALRGVQRSK